MIKADVLEVIKKYPKIALAVSGGSDSMAMLYWFIQNRPISSFLVVNIDHQIRGQESKNDSSFVENFCIKNGVEFIKFTVECAQFAQCNGYTLEQAARIRRHNIFFEICMDKVSAVATAHHADDQAESIFMHIARGTGIDGLVGMGVVDGHLLRPLINTSKAEIMQYIKDNNIPYVEDSTNFSNSYTRNFVRNQVIPLIQSRYPNFKENLIKLSNRSKEYQDFIDLYTPKLTASRNCVKLDIQGKHKVIATEMIRRAFKLLGIEQDIEERHIELILELSDKQNNTYLDMPYDTRVYKENGLLVVEVITDYTFSEFVLTEGVFDLPDGHLIVQKIGSISDLNSYTDGEKDLYIDAKKVTNAVVRLRKNGDKINKFGDGSKSLGDFLTDKKMPLRLRDRTPVIAINNQIYGVIGLDISADCKVDASSKVIYKISYLHD